MGKSMGQNQDNMLLIVFSSFNDDFTDLNTDNEVDYKTIPSLIAGRWFHVRIIPLRLYKHRIEGEKGSIMVGYRENSKGKKTKICTS